jgi:LuxR family transcriptional regulator, maltose regulon positive regulatory protein
MRIQLSSHQGCVVLALAGRLDLAAAPQVQRAILKQLAEQPPAIICDLGQVEAIDPLCAAVFTSIRHPALGWPGTALVLSGTRPAVADLLVRQGVARRLAMYPSLDQALKHARDRPLPLRERLALDPVSTAAGAARLLASELVWSKLRPPAPRAGLLSRARLQVRLQASLQGKLCLVDAPAGFGKTTLLAQWCAGAGAGRVAWVSLDEGDNDATRFWMYVVEALRTVEPDVGAIALQALRRPSADLYRTVLPSLLNELSAIGSQLVLVLDDYHLVTNATCHRTLGFFLDHLPPGVHVALSTRADPPLPLARMRAKGELGEIRFVELEFTDEEASALLNGSMRLQLAAADVERLAERTEGWPAGLYLAGLSLRGRQDASGFIASFHGDNHHVADYLGAEVLAHQPEQIRAFLLRTSILERLSGPVCDAVLETEGSRELLGELERSNLFLTPLDDHREWYRYHHLFAQLLRVELGHREPELLPALHRRAAAWHRRAGNVEEAIHHATAAGEFSEAATLIARHWLGHWRRGRLASVARWLDELPDEAITADPPVAYVAAWIRGFSGASKQETERWLTATEDATWEGVLPDGIKSLAFGAALTRAALLFDDVGRSADAARRALDLTGPEPSPFLWMAQAALGRALYLSGHPAEARPGLEELVRVVPPSAQPFAVMTALAVLSLIAGDKDDDRTAATLARRAAEVAEAQGLNAEPLCGIVHLALGRALSYQGQFAQAEEQLGRALGLLEIDSMVLHRAHTLLLLASVRRGHGDLPGARALVDQAHELIERCADPGILTMLLEQAVGALDTAPYRRVESAPLTERELAVLRLLPARLSNREIGRELNVSINTVRSHVQAIYRKFEVVTRDEAVAHARQLGLLPGSTRTHQ